MISCKKATELLSKQMEEPLDQSEELSLKLHLFICECCVKFREQIRLISKALRKDEKNETAEDPLLDCKTSDCKGIQNAKERLKEKLKSVDKG